MIFVRHMPLHRDQLAQLMFPQFDLSGSVKPIAEGYSHLPPPPGRLVKWSLIPGRHLISREAKKVILVRRGRPVPVI
jgi:pyruvate,orthophosphate dikinase